jgi:hypothetical protein
MDDIVKQAIAKWPNVPHCYGWLGLDARGVWRMRDERAQHLGLRGEPISAPKLLGFINRNYDVDPRGCWFFQNGPQRVYLQLEATPFIARTDPQWGLVLHTGEPVATLDRAFLTDAGALIVQTGDKVAQVDDRDVAQLMAAFEIDGQPASDEALMAWLGDGDDGDDGDCGAGAALTLRYRDRQVAVAHIASAQLAAQFGFVRTPAP